jgi:ribonuclease HI
MSKQSLPSVIVYTDGACRPNPGPGGWAAILRFELHERVLTGYDANTTNNRMELQAAIAALSALKKSCQVDLYVDSIYLKRGVTEWMPYWQRRNWRTRRGEPVKNVDLWQRLDDLTRRHEITWHWLKGHSGDPGNERANRLAREALDKGSATLR